MQKGEVEVVTIIEVCLSGVIAVEAMCILYLLWVTRPLAAVPRQEEHPFVRVAEAAPATAPRDSQPVETQLSSRLSAGTWTQSGKGTEGLSDAAGSTAAGESPEDKALREKADRVFAGVLRPRRLDSGEIARREHFLMLHTNGGQITPGTPTRKVD